MHSDLNQHYRGFKTSVLRAAVLMLLGLISFAGCRFWEPSDVIYKRYALYNLEEEGYLASDIIQTRGKANSTADSGKVQRDRICAQKALEKAQFRMARIFLHTRLSIPPVPVTGNRASFDQDYPVQFSDRDLFLATIDYAAILQKGYIALQDTSDGNVCTVVFRIRDPNLIDEIKSVDLSFQPESYDRTWENRNETSKDGQSTVSPMFP
ncbi:MAG TPA: hypothetical protein DEA96_02740 [Leptospiraceae bacterium]|nr:hypothetical protein [Spirochaetaceae bacterium]HBS03854.1 hypothetical protein [Leptospiraceae bacterium]|tara:strand:+ start:102536 stop:103162 length:627 start_codon:yes stop_codon:yes gene_type:complete